MLMPMTDMQEHWRYVRLRVHR